MWDVMSKTLKKLFKKFILAYIAVSIISLVVVYYNFSSDTNWMSFLGSFLGGIIGGFATLTAIYFTIMSLKQEDMPLVIPMRTVIYGYYNSGMGTHVTDENISEDIQSGEVDNHKFHFNPFNTAFMKFVNVGKDSALNIEIEWGNPYNSELYDILLSYGIPHEYFEKHFNTSKTAILYSDYMLPIKKEPETYRVQITDELVSLFEYVMAIFLGALREYAIDDKTAKEFGNNFIRKKHKFTTVKVRYEDLNGNPTEQEFDIYCRIQTLFGTYNGGYEKMQIELTTSKIIN